MRDLERVKAYIDLGYEKEVAVKMVDDEEKAQAKLEKKTESTEQPTSVNEDIQSLMNEVADLKKQIQSQAFNNATSSGTENTETASDVMERIYGSKN